MFCIPSILPSPPREGVRMQVFVLDVDAFNMPLKNPVKVLLQYALLSAHQ